jgi:hypothetical protein
MASRNKFSHRKRRIGFRDLRPRFLIVCEDTKSAPNYFNGFRIKSAKIIPIGAGKNTLTLVEEAIILAELHNIDFARDQVWVVMDRDEFPQDDYDNAFQKAAAAGLKIAYSHECIEFWFLLHFAYTSATHSRKDLPKKLTAHIGKSYRKGMEDLYELVYPMTETAIQNAKNLLKSHREAGNLPLRNAHPSTNVHELVIEILRYL